LKGKGQMKKIGLFYSFNSAKTAKIAEKIKSSFTGHDIQNVNVEIADENSLALFDCMIFGAATWFDGELPNYWDEYLPAVEEADLSGKKLAIFGLGDQINYPENFCDAIGIIADFFEKRGAQIVGKFPVEGFNFEASKAVRNNEFLGLPLDQENQARLTNMRIEKWVETLKLEFI
jgi:flavodoxin I